MPTHQWQPQKLSNCALSQTLKNQHITVVTSSTHSLPVQTYHQKLTENKNT